MSTDLVGFPTARKTSRANLLAGWLAGGKLRLYTESRPASADTAISNQTLLAEYSLPDPAGTVSNGVLTGPALSSALVLADGSAAWARAVDSSGVTVLDLDVGLAGSGASVIIDSLSLVTGGLVAVQSWSITEG